MLAVVDEERLAEAGQRRPHESRGDRRVHVHRGVLEEGEGAEQRGVVARGEHPVRALGDVPGGERREHGAAPQQGLTAAGPGLHPPSAGVHAVTNAAGAGSCWRTVRSAAECCASSAMIEPSCWRIAGSAIWRSAA